MLYIQFKEMELRTITYIPQGIDGMAERSSMMSTISAGNIPNRDSVMSVVSVASVVPRESSATDVATAHLQEPTADPAELPDPLQSLDGLLNVISLVDAAIMQNIYLNKLILYRDIKLGEFRESEQAQELGSCAGAGRSSIISSAASASFKSKINDAVSSTGDEDSLSIATVCSQAHAILSRCYCITT